MLILDLGRKDYKEVWDLQKKIHERRVEEKIPDTMILVEHNPVITMGRAGKQSNVLWPLDLLKERGVQYYEIERGGDVTYHGPGQLIGYPIFNVRDGFAGIKPFINAIEKAIIAMLADFAITGMKNEKMIGVWTEEGKICSIGIAVRRWVSFHGFALNVNTDLGYFDLIVPCGLKNVEMTSMQQILGKEVSLDGVRKSIIMNFGRIFSQNISMTSLREVV